MLKVNLVPGGKFWTKNSATSTDDRFAYRIRDEGWEFGLNRKFVKEEAGEEERGEDDDWEEAEEEDSW